MEKGTKDSADAATGGPSAGAARVSRVRRLMTGLRPVDPTDDRRLAEECLKGDQRSWSALIEKYKNLIYSIPIKYGASHDEAGDIFQAVCLELFTELPRLRNTESLRPWLMTVAAHQAYHWKLRRLRRKRSEVEGLEQESVATVALPPAVAAEVEREQMVREAIARLPPRCRAMVRMLFYEQPAKPYADVAKSLGLATGSIGFIRRRCLKRLERALEELGF